MCDEPLAEELADIERHLFVVHRTRPAIHLRSRVLSGVREQLRRD